MAITVDKGNQVGVCSFASRGPFRAPALRQDADECLRGLLTSLSGTLKGSSEASNRRQRWWAMTPAKCSWGNVPFFQSKMAEDG